MNKPAVSWWRGWAPLVVLPVAVILATPAHWPRWAFMWLLAFVIFFGCKWLTWRRTPNVAPVWMHVGYLLAWPGMDAPSFFTQPARATLTPAATEWLFAAGKLAVGAALIFAVVPVARQHAPPYLVGWIGMVGLVIVLHFGVFHLLSCLWRRAGVGAVPLMNYPVASCSVSEFWGKRWNLAFRDLTYRFLFRPVMRRLGPGWALGIAFTCSGLVHDTVISVPAGGGYGGPTLYFLLQVLAIFVERSALGQRWRLGRGWTGWLFAMIVLLGPAYLLFQPVFVEGIVVPFLDDLGAK